MRSRWQRVITAAAVAGMVGALVHAQQTTDGAKLAADRVLVWCEQELLPASVCSAARRSEQAELCAEGLVPRASCASTPAAPRPSQAERRATLCTQGLAPQSWCTPGGPAAADAETRSAESRRTCAAGLVAARSCQPSSATPPTLSERLQALHADCAAGRLAAAVCEAIAEVSSVPR